MTINLFDFNDYKLWVIKHVDSMPKRGHGQWSRIAEHLGTKAAIVTQVFKGDRDLTPEQALLLAEHFGLSNIETRYFILLVNFSRSGTYRYKQLLKSEIETLKQQATEIKNRVQQTHALSEETKTILYSSWHHLGVWSLCALEGFSNTEAISTRLKISRQKTNESINFLKEHGLLVEEKNQLRPGPTLIHLESTSPQIARHHTNWRLKAFQKYENPGEGDCSYTAPITLSGEDARALREKILQFISETISRVKDSPSEKFYCLNIDWFEV